MKNGKDFLLTLYNVRHVITPANLPMRSVKKVANYCPYRCSHLIHHFPNFPAHLAFQSSLVKSHLPARFVLDILLLLAFTSWTFCSC